MNKPELLAPAGNLEKLKIAMSYGADACYIGGHVFGLRKYADNFTLDDIREAVAFANTRGKQVYLVLNGFAHNEDLDSIEAHLKELEAIQPHALIISDMGVFQLAKQLTSIPLHVSTQASVTNAYGCQFWKDAGAKRVILAREVSIEECKRIKEAVDIELEIFVHGAMCASYSGKCVISNYTAGRDSNRGGCVQSCRHTFQIDEDSSHVMNAKDLMGIRQLPAIIEAGIESIKIEGRMKSNLYAANVCRAYRKALDGEWDVETSEAQLRTVSNRTFSSGGLDHRPGAESIAYEFDRYEKSVDYIGTVKDVTDEVMLVDVKFAFNDGDELELLTFDGEVVLFQAVGIQNMLGHGVEKTNPNSLVKLPLVDGAERLHVIRKPI